MLNNKELKKIDTERNNTFLMELDSIKNGIILFMSENEMKPTKKNFDLLLKNSQPIAAYINNYNLGLIQLSLQEMKPKRSKKTILKEIENIENKRLEYGRKPRISTGSYSQIMSNFSLKLRKLNFELESVA